MLYRKSQKSLIKAENIGKEEVTYTLIFSKANRLVWLNKFLKKDFAHVKILIHKKGYIVLIDPRMSYNEVTCFSDKMEYKPLEWETIIKGKAMVDVYKTRRYIGLLNCVETAKAFIGDRSFWCLTPYQLYNKLEKQ